MALLKRPLPKPVGNRPKVLLKPGANVKLRPDKAFDPDAGPKKRAISKDGAFARANAVKEEIANRVKEPWRLSVPIGGKVVGYFLDRGEPWSRYEHKIGGGPGKRPKIFPCIKDTGQICPICESDGKEGNHTLFLTIIIPRMTYTRKNERGNEETVVQKYAKRLVPIGLKMTGKYQRLYEKHGTFRGMKVTIQRDGKMDAGSGNDVEFEAFLTEKEMTSLARQGILALEEYCRTNSKDIKDLDSDFLNPFDYDKDMPTPDQKELAKMARVSDRRGGVGSADFEDDDDFAGGGSAASDGWGD